MEKLIHSLDSMIAVSSALDEHRRFIMCSHFNDLPQERRTRVLQQAENQAYFCFRSMVGVRPMLVEIRKMLHDTTS